MPVRVLLLTGSLGPGGTELSVVRLALGLKERGRAEPRVAVLGRGGSYTAALRQQGVEVDELGVSGRLYLPGGIKRLLTLGELVRRERIGIVHTFLFDADVYGMLAARTGGPWGVITTRRAIKKDKPLHLLGYRLSNGFADRIVCNSEAVRDFTLRRENPPVDKVRVIPGGVDVTAFAAGDRARQRAALGLDPRSVVVGAIGTIKQVKGQAVLLEAMAPLLQRDRDLRLCLAGEVTAGYGAELRERVEQLGLASQVLLPGVVHDVPGLLAALDLFVLPSLSEGMSNALMEAMAAGKPIVATTVGGNEENLDRGTAGVLVPAGNPEALREAIGRMLDDRDLRLRLGHAAAARAREQYAFSRMLERTERLYSELVEEMFGKVFRERLQLPSPGAGDPIGSRAGR